MSRQARPINLVDIPIEKFWARVDRRGDDECWPWTGAVDTETGYGRMRLPTGTAAFSAHRVSYVVKHGAVPTNMVIDHICRNRACVNPAHLEPVTNEENIQRGQWCSVLNAAKTHCIHGHEFTPENTRIEKDGQRACRACGRDRTRRYSLKRSSNPGAGLEPRPDRDVP